MMRIYMAEFSVVFVCKIIQKSFRSGLKSGNFFIKWIKTNVFPTYKEKVC